MRPRVHVYKVQNDHGKPKPNQYIIPD